MPRIILLTDFSEEYANRLMKGIVDYSRGAADSWVLCKMPLSYRDTMGVEGVLEWALQWQADAIIAQFYNNDNVGIFREHGIIAVAQDFKQRFTEIPNITGAHFETGQMGAKYFVERGFRNFAFYGFKGIVWSEERCRGFADEITRSGYGENIWEYRNENFDDLWFYNNDSLMSWLRGLPKPVAIMACDDNQGRYVIEACNQCGIAIPEEAAILGVDNDNIVCTLSNPPLSSINQNVEKGGYDAAALIERMIHDPALQFEDVVVASTHVVSRQSTDVFACDDIYISTVLKYIHENSNCRMVVDEIVDLVPLSRRLLETRFKKVTGNSVYSYMLKLRINRFAEKLIESDAPVIDIATEMGFLDFKNVSRQFKNLKGYAPSKFREMNARIKNKASETM